MSRERSFRISSKLKIDSSIKGGFIGIGLLVQFIPGFAAAAPQVSFEADTIDSIVQENPIESVLNINDDQVEVSGSRPHIEDLASNEFLGQMYDRFYSDYSKEIRMNFSKVDLDAILRSEMNSHKVAEKLLKLVTMNYFLEIIFGLNEDRARIIDQLLVQNDKNTASMMLEAAISEQLVRERVKLKEEALDPKLKLSRFNKFERQEKQARLDVELSDVNAVHGALDSVFKVIESKYFLNTMVKKFANYLQMIKAIHTSCAFGDVNKLEQLGAMRNEIEDIIPLLERSSRDRADESREERLASFNRELDDLKATRLEMDTLVDLEVIELMREVLVGEYHVPAQTLYSKIANSFKSSNKKFGRLKSNHELDYIRRRIGVSYSSACPKDYKADFYQFFSGQKSFLTEEVLGVFETIKSGKFRMGSKKDETDRVPSEGLRHVTLDTFQIMNNAVSQLTYATVMGSNPSHFSKKKFCKDSFQTLILKGKKVDICSDHPVEKVSFEDANRFVEQINLIFDGSVYQYRLPTEAEAEYAILRGGSTSAYVSGADASDLENFILFNHDPDSRELSSRKSTYSVSRMKMLPNDFGIYRSGVWEWTQDWFGPATYGSEENPRGPGSGTMRVLKGGSYLKGSKECRSARRVFLQPEYSGRDIGFRLVRVLKDNG